MLLQAATIDRHPSALAGLRPLARFFVLNLDRLCPHGLFCSGAAGTAAFCGGTPARRAGGGRSGGEPE
jgi:hypothetical protein